MSQLHQIITVVAWLVMWQSATAHPVPFSYLDLRLETGRIEATLVVHVIDVAHELNIESPGQLLDEEIVGTALKTIVEMIEPRFKVASDGYSLAPKWSPLVEVMSGRQSVRLHFSYSLDVTPGVVGIEGSLFPYDQNHRTFVNIYEEDSLRLQAILGATHERVDYFTGTWQGTAAVFRKFIPIGVVHILNGLDHVLFLVGLLLLGGTLRQLLVVVTAFTVAHSVTLSLSVLNLFNPPPGLIEPAIALSIVYVGADNRLVGDKRDMRAWIALVFGLIHGFGFANVLREMGLPSREVATSLLSFNLGVEFGQVVVVIVVGSLLTALREWSEIAGRRIVFIGSLAVIAAGVFWFIERVFFPGGVL